MKTLWPWACVIVAVVGCAGARPVADIPVTQQSIIPGTGQSVNRNGKPLPLEGTPFRVGQQLPAAILTAADLTLVKLTETQGKVRIISVVPSLDTRVCEQQTHRLSEQNGGLDRRAQLITVSMDLPYAQARFARAAKIDNVLFLSDHVAAEFGRATGLLITPLRLLTRAVLVVDRDNVIRYAQVVPELGQLPDLQQAFAAAQRLL